MESFSLRIFSLKFSFGITVNNPHSIFDLLSVFGEVSNGEIPSIRLNHQQKNTKELNDKIRVLIDKYKDQIPHIRQLKAKFELLDENEYFFIFPDTELSNQESLSISIALRSLNHNNDYDVEMNEYNDSFKCIFENYNMIVFDKNKKTKIGESEKTKRVCRFCGKSQPDTRFNNVAHSISEAFGNKNLITNDECDECNCFFDENIERDIISYLSLPRIFFGIKGKKGIPKIKGSNFTLSNKDGKFVIEFKGDVEIGEDDDPPKSLKLETHDKISLQSIYKSLCKFALSVIDYDQIEYFQDTVNWLKSNNIQCEIPKIALMRTYNFFGKSPEITIYLRKSNNTELPYMVGEFRWTFLVFVFIVPFSNKDSISFSKQKEYDIFWDCFRHYKESGPWSFHDFSDPSKKQLVININNGMSDMLPKA